ncbi:MAG: septum site-determining protein MinD [Caldiserica bacterium]|nr:MAG: septum site-determining protein MinD [Caldisericota bacterium]
MGRAIVITSGKGGVGKTTITANLGASLAKLKKKVVLVDMDIGLRNLDVVMGLENKIVYNIIDVAESRCKIVQALVRDKHLNNSLFLLPASQIHTKDDIDIDKICEIIRAIKGSFDYVLVDSPAGIEHGFDSAITSADEALVVVTPDVSSIRDADRVIGLLENRGIDGTSLIINRHNPALVKRKKILDAESIVDVLGIDLIGIIPEDPQVMEFTNKGEILVLHKNNPTAKAFQNTAKRIEGEDISFLDLKKKKSFFNLFKKK